MSFIKGTATFTNGSKTVTSIVLTSGSLAYIASGTNVVVGADPVVAQIEAVSATDTTVELRSNWPHTTGSYTFIAYDTVEGLRDAVQAARVFGDRLSEANAILTSLTNIYDDTASGIAATSNLDYFSVAGTGDVFITLYRNDAGIAVQQESLSSKAFLDGIVSTTTSASSQAQTARNEAVTAKDDAETARATVLASETTTTDARDEAVLARDAAQTAEGIATTARDQALTARDIAQTSATNAQTAEGVAIASANFAGLWADQTGAATVPVSVEHSGNIWMLNTDVADIALEEPGVSSTWTSIGSTGNTANNALSLGGETAAQWDTKIDAKANASHNHSISDVTNLPSELASKADATATQTSLDDLDERIKRARVLALAGI